MNWLDLIIIVCLAIGLLIGLFDGFIKQVISLISLILAIVFAGRLAQPIKDFLIKQPIITDSISTPVLTVICYVLAFLAIIFILSILGKLLDESIRVTPAKPLNAILGGIFGSFVWILSLSILFNLIAIFDTHSNILNKQTQDQSVYYNKVKTIVPTMYPYVKDYFKK